MNISPHHLSLPSTANMTSDQSEKSPTSDELVRPEKVQDDNVTLSSQAHAFQTLDSPYNELDSIYESHLSAKDIKSIDQAYSRLDEIFSNAEPLAKEQAEADKIFDRLDSIFQQAESKISAGDRERIAQLDEQISAIETSLSDEEYNVLSPEQEKQLLALEEEQNNLLLSKLSASERKEVEGLNKQIEALFDKKDFSDADQKQIDGLFDVLDNTLSRSFEQLSADKQEKVMALDQKIEQLLSHIESTTTSDVLTYGAD